MGKKWDRTLTLPSELGLELGMLTERKEKEERGFKSSAKLSALKIKLFCFRSPISSTVVVSFSYGMSH